MADVFSNVDTKLLLENKHIMFFGDSNTRALYKDVLWLLNHNTLIANKLLRSKLETSFLGDTLVEGSRLHRGRDFKEIRRYFDKNDGTTVEFVFLTRCYNRLLQDIFSDFKKKKRSVPDVIVINSCLWDLTRWGPNGVPEYKDNMVKLMRMMGETLPEKCLVIWTTTLSTAAHVRGGLLIKQIEFMEPLMRFEVMEANTFAREVVVNHGFDVLDNHYYTRMQMHRRAKDGVHYMPIPVRFMTNLLLTHIALSWDCELPRNISSVLLDKAIALDTKPVEQPIVNIPSTGIFSKINLVSPVVSKHNGLKITFNTGGGRKCKLFEESSYEQDVLAQVSQQDFDEPKIHSYVQQNFQGSSSSIGPARRKKNKKRKKNPYHDNRHPYQDNRQLYQDNRYPYHNNRYPYHDNRYPYQDSHYPNQYYY